ncbi:MAG: FtsW/RodA/SpoVE family cell cycle protein, partial [Candidatus Yanofskybacteria bacterium]|nr:FtsW/RodA/SpoVE family cell cycle protein [Candidatus Yanofskybacteria bacterium]
LISQPDMGTLIVVTMLAISLYFFAGAKLSQFFIMMLVLAVLLGALAVAEPYRFDRLKAFLNPTVDTQDTSYHINQALLGIGAGGLFGRGFGQSQQKFNYLPEPVGDSIFSIFVEELGFAGAAVLLSLFTWLILAITAVARRTHNEFAKLLVAGVAVWIGGQAFVNIAAISGLIPLTGVPLPFISFGSSSLVSVMAGLGIVANISKHA